jgi:type IV pilus assembly protein PilM
LGSSSIKLAQLRSEADQLDLVAAASIRVPVAVRDKPAKRHAFFANAIRKLVKNTPFKGRQCIMSMPSDTTLVEHVKIPKVPPKEIEAVLRRELRSKVVYDVDDAVIRHIIAGDAHSDGETKLEVIAVCVSREELNAYIQTTRKAKLDVIGVNIESCAIVECFSRLFRRTTDGARAILYLDMGATNTQVVFAQGRKMAFSRSLGIGGEHLDQVLAESLSISAKEAYDLRLNPTAGGPEGFDEHALHTILAPKIDELADELTKCLRYYESVFRNQGVERAIFLGGGAYDKRLCQSLAQRLNLPAQIGDPLVRVNREHAAGLAAGMDRDEPLPDWAVAIGLSLGADQAA